MNDVEQVYVSKDRPQYASVPSPLIDALRERRISYPAVALYAALDLYRNRKTGDCYPGLRTLAADLGIGLGTASRLMRALVAGGFVRVQDPVKPRDPTRYTLVFGPGSRSTGGTPNGGSRSTGVPPSSALPPPTPPLVVVGESSRSTPISSPDPVLGEPKEPAPGPAHAGGSDRRVRRGPSCLTCGEAYTAHWDESAKRNRRRCRCGVAT